MARPIRVLVVDDSAVMRTLITDILQTDAGISVVGKARDGLQALEMVARLQPDVVTLDIEMPVMDGLSALQRIMADSPCPVVMLSAMNQRQADITMKALDLGAVDFIPKSSGSISLNIDQCAPAIVQKVRTAAASKVVPFPAPGEPRGFPRFSLGEGDWLVAIGASTGGPKAIPEVLSRLPRDLPAGVLVVQHMPEGFTRSFAERLNWVTSLEVREAEDGDEVRAGLVLVAPGDLHMEVRGNLVHLNKGPRMNYSRPSADVLMVSAAKAFRDHCVGVLLTGMGRDGAVGMQTIRKHGGTTIAQDEETSVVWGMPKAAIDLDAAQTVRPLWCIHEDILAAMQQR